MDQIQRVMVVVIDGVRADALPLFRLPRLQQLAARGASTLHATTVTPSVTAAAMGSLFSGLTPDAHGLDSDRFRLPRPRVPLEPLPRVLRNAGVPMFCFLAALPRAYRPLARRLAGMIGVEDATFHGQNSTEILAAATPVLRSRRRGAFVFHFPDADRAGHASGWMSRPYRAAAERLDETVGVLDDITGASRDDETLLIILADHGGGGTNPRNHDSSHPHDRRIPLIICGGQVAPGALGPGASLLDVPATVLSAFGVHQPARWAGRSLLDEVRRLPQRVAVPGGAA